MFAETLLESSPTGRKRKRWPMATAFTVETIVAAVLVIVPLLSTGVIPLSARVQIAAPLKETPLEPKRRVRPEPNSSSNPANSVPRHEVVRLVSDNRNAIHWGHDDTATTTNPVLATPGGDPNGNAKGMPNMPTGNGSDVKLQPKRVPISDLSPGQLINRVEPVYPRMAGITGVQGEVKLHAIIARDGRIMSLNLISGHPLLARAAEDAVSQWRYRPYYLNGEPVEVETFITVHFTRGQR